MSREQAQSQKLTQSSVFAWGVLTFCDTPAAYFLMGSRLREVSGTPLMEKVMEFYNSSSTNQKVGASVYRYCYIFRN